MRSLQKKVIIGFTLCIIACLFSVIIADKQKGNYIGILQFKRNLYLYVKDSLNNPFEPPVEYLFVPREGDTAYLKTGLDTSIGVSLLLINDHFKKGKLFKLPDIEDCYFAYQTNSWDLLEQYLAYTDCIDISNSKYTLSLSPINKEAHLSLGQNSPLESRSKKKFPSQCRKARHPLVTVDSPVIPSRISPSADWDEWYIFTDTRFPGVQLFYQRKGFSYETGKITQYPFVMVTDNYPKGEVISKYESRTLYKWDNRIKKKYSFLLYDGGFLLYHNESPNHPLPSKADLDTLISISNKCIHFTLSKMMLQ